MSTIKEAIKLVEEMEEDELNHVDAVPTDMGMGSDIGGDTLEPSEPPVSDSAIGADTEGESALALLRSMKNSLEQIATAVAPVEEMPPGAEGGPGGMPGGMPGEMPGEMAGEGDEMPMPDEPPTDIEAAAEADTAEEAGEEADEEAGEAEEDEAEAEEDEAKARK